jgi:hypothetical protein
MSHAGKSAIAPAKPLLEKCSTATDLNYSGWEIGASIAVFCCILATIQTTLATAIRERKTSRHVQYQSQNGNHERSDEPEKFAASSRLSNAVT